MGAALLKAYPLSKVALGWSALQGVGLEEVKARVERGDFNAALVANAGASAALMAALVNTSAAAYDPTGAMR